MGTIRAGTVQCDPGTVRSACESLSSIVPLCGHSREAANGAHAADALATAAQAVHSLGDFPWVVHAALDAISALMGILKPSDADGSLPHHVAEESACWGAAAFAMRR